MDFVVEDDSTAELIAHVEYPNSVKVGHKMDVGILVGKKYNQIKLKFTYKIHIDVLRYYYGQHKQSGKNSYCIIFSSSNAFCLSI